MSDSQQPISKNQVRKLGSRLRKADVPAIEDASAYIQWSQGFRVALSEVESAVQVQALQVCERDSFAVSSRIKQLKSARAKLVRMRTSLSDLEDIAGCRVIVATLDELDDMSRKCANLNVTRVRDYREEAHNGYRAIHLIVRSQDGNPVELQLRTKIQHSWAQLTERAAAAAGMEVKYGGGPVELRAMLDKLSEVGRKLDVLGRSLNGVPTRLGDVEAVDVERKPWEAQRRLRDLRVELPETERLFHTLCDTLFSETGEQQ